MALDDDKVTSAGSAERGAPALTGFLRGIDASRPRHPHLTAVGHSYGSLVTSLAVQAGTGVDDVVLVGSPGAALTDGARLGTGSGRVYHLAFPHDPVDQLAEPEKIIDPQYDRLTSEPHVRWVNERPVVGPAAEGLERRLHDEAVRGAYRLQPFGPDLGVVPNVTQVPVEGGLPMQAGPAPWLATPVPGAPWLRGEPDKGAIDIHSSYFDENSQSQYQMSQIIIGRPDLLSRPLPHTLFNRPWTTPPPPETP